MRAKRTIIAAALLAGPLIAALAQPASANLITPGGSGVTPDHFTTSPGTLVTSTGHNFTGGSETEYVYKATSISDGLCAGCLNFVFLVNDFTATINGVSTSSFAGFTTDAGYNTSLGFGTSAPDDLARSSDGTTIVFDFAADLGDGHVTDFLEIETNALTDAPGLVSALNDGVVVGSGAGFEPSGAAVPEPASLALFGSGLVGLVGLLRRRRKSVAAI